MKTVHDSIVYFYIYQVHPVTILDRQVCELLVYIAKQTLCVT